MSYVEFVEELRSVGIAKAFQAEEYKAEENALAEKLVKAEDALLETLTTEQLELYNELDDCIGEYTDVLEKDTFLQGFSLGKELSKMIK